MAIPIQNIYYLLCYAWNKLDEKEKVQVDIENSTQLLDLFAKVLISGSKRLLKRGIDRSYKDETLEIAGVKGKIEFGETIKRRLLYKKKTICNFDEFSANILLNQILLTTLYRLRSTKSLDKGLKDQLRNISMMFGSIEMITLTSSTFKQVRFNRNNKFYAFLINVCEIVYGNTLPTEEPGRFVFTDFTRDERKMNQLFESFIRNFYKIEQKEYTTVKKEGIKWNFTTTDRVSDRYLPGMDTDITLENETRKIIIDAKYYKETMTSYYDTRRVHSNNLYQLFSYLLNQETPDIKTRSTTGILLYPTIDKEYNLEYSYDNHLIQIKTVNLNASWKNIESRLKQIIEIPFR